MSRWVWWPVVGLCGFVACGGSSLRRNPGGDDDGTSGSAGVSVGSGGTSGGAGASGGKGGTSKGGSPSTGGRGGTTVTGGRGGSVPQGGVGNTSGDAGAAGDPAGGSAGVPVCELAGGSTCSAAATCAALGCGMPWSIYDENQCHRQSCEGSGLCKAGERCIIAPVAGGFGPPCRSEADSCERLSSGCECIFYEECSPVAVCLPADEFPPENDCPIENLDCAGLEQAATTLGAYITGDGFFFPEPYELPGNLAASLEACAQAVEVRLEACN